MATRCAALFFPVLSFSLSSCRVLRILLSTVIPFLGKWCWLLYLSLDCVLCTALRKHAYSNILKILPSKNENCQIKNSDINHISAPNIDCGYSLEPPRWGGSNEYPQYMFLSRNKKNNVYPCKSQFYYIKVGFKGVKVHVIHVIVMCLSWFVFSSSW